MTFYKLNKTQIIENIKNYRTLLWMFRNTGSDCYLAQAIDVYEITNKNLERFGLQLKRKHRLNRRKS